jgi:hypothetical protein
MEKLSFKFLVFVFIVLAAVIIFFQFRTYRTPMEQTSTETITETDGQKHSIPLNEIISGGVKRDGIPSIDKPRYESVAVADRYLDDDGFGLLVEVNNRARFYPYQVLVWHEIVNDNFQGKKLAVTYCPLCFSGIVFGREFNDQVFEFGTSGKLYNSNLLMYDRTSDSLWSQALGEAVVGPLTGKKLEVYPSLTISWNEFKKNFRSGEVLSKNTGESRDYTRNPYGDYFINNSIFFPVNNKDSRLESKQIIFGAKNESGTKAFALEDVQKTKLINDKVGDLPVLVLWDQTLKTVKAFERQIDGKEITFSLSGETIVDESGSKWNSSGRSTAGSNNGFKLKVIPLENTFWFSWASSHPKTEVYQLP